MPIRHFITLLALAALAACTAPTPDSRYATTDDAAPATAISAEQVADAVPRADPILAAGNLSPYTVRGVTYEVLTDYQDYSESGVASWYGAKFNGYETSNGEIFDHYKATAAHKTLPIPSYARVTNLDNDQSVIVRVNDRGPFHPDRIIDLSYAGAVKIGYMELGTARVRVETLDVLGADDRRDVPSGSYRFLQIGAFGSESSAVKLQGELQALLSAPVFIKPVDSGGNRLYRVRVGPVDDGEHLESLQRVLVEHGHQQGQPLP